MKRTGILKSKKTSTDKPVKAKKVTKKSAVKYVVQKDVYQADKRGSYKYLIREEQTLIRKTLFDNKSAESPQKITLSFLKKELGRELVMTPEEISDFIEASKDAAEFIIVDGKKYKKGTFVDVHVNPYIHEPGVYGGKKKKGILGGLEHINASGKERDIVAVDDIPEDAPEDHQEPEEKPQKKSDDVDYGDHESSDDEHDNEKEDIDDVVETYTGENVVREYDYEFQETDVFTGLEKEYAIRFGVDTKHTKLMPILREDKARPTAKVAFSKSEKYEVVEGPYGILTLKHYAPFGYDGATLFEKQDSAPSQIVKRSPAGAEFPEPPSNYKGDFKFGEYVSFQNYTTSDLIEGIVTSTRGDSFNLVSIGDSPKRYIAIEYPNVSNVILLDYPDDIKSEKPNQIIVGETIIDINPRKCSNETYCKGIKPNTFIRFKFTKTHREGKGYITGFTDDHYIILTSKGKYSVPYTQKLHLENRPLIRIEFKAPAIEDILEDSVLPGTRERCTQILFDLLASLFSKDKAIYASDVEKDVRLEKLSANIDWTLHNFGILEWSAYYDVEFNKFLYSKYSEIIRMHLPDYTQDAITEYRYQISPEYATDLVTELSNAFGNDIFDENGAVFLNKMEETARLPYFRHTMLTSFMRTEFNRIGRPKLVEFQGEMLARIITKCIMKFRQLYQKKASEIKKIMEDGWIDKQFQELKGTEEDQREFNETYLTQVSDNYQFLEFTYTENEKLVTAYNLAKENLKKDLKARTQKVQESGVVLKGKSLSEEGAELHRQVIVLEEKIHELHGDTNLDYLIKMHEIILFLDPKSRPGKYANFFRAKILSGNFTVEHLISSTVYHAFPEFFINQSLSDREFVLGVRLLKEDLLNSVIEFTNNWILQHQSSKPTEPGLLWKNLKDWKAYVTDVPTKCAESGSLRIKKDGVFDGTTKDDYDCQKMKNGDTKCVAKRENISEDDAILCYSDRKFVCLSINDILYALSDRRKGAKKVMNPITNIPYTEDFLERMDERYGDLVTDAYNGRVLEFTIPSGKEAIVKSVKSKRSTKK